MGLGSWLVGAALGEGAKDAFEAHQLKKKLNNLAAEAEAAEIADRINEERRHQELLDAIKNRR